METAKISRKCAAQGCARTFTPRNVAQLYCSTRCKNREAQRRFIRRLKGKQPNQGTSTGKIEGDLLRRRNPLKLEVTADGTPVQGREQASGSALDPMAILEAIGKELEGEERQGQLRVEVEGSAKDPWSS